MKDQILDKLKTEWLCAKDEQDYRKLGKILRSSINYLKSIDSGLKTHETELLSKIEYLQDHLKDMEFDVSIQVIGDVRHARKSVKASSGTWGSAFKVELSASERRAIRRKNKSPAFNDRGLNGAQGNAAPVDHDALLDRGSGADE